MNPFKKIFSWTLLYKTYDLITNIYYWYKDYKVVSDTFYSDAFKTVLKKYLNLDVSEDWIGRLYGIVNPNIDWNGNFNVSNTILEIDGENTNNNDQVKHWAFKQLTLISKLFKIEQLYDYITFTFDHVGPTNADNYLFVFDITSRISMANSFKSWFKHLFVYIIIACIAILTIVLI